MYLRKSDHTSLIRSMFWPRSANYRWKQPYYWESWGLHQQYLGNNLWHCLGWQWCSSSLQATRVFSIWYVIMHKISTERTNSVLLCIPKVSLQLVVVLLKIWNQCIYRESLALVQRLLCSIVPLLPLKTQHAPRDLMQVLFAKVYIYIMFA